MASHAIHDPMSDLDNAEVHRLADELARRTGQNRRDAMREALQAALARGSLDERILANATDVAGLRADLDRLSAGLREAYVVKYGYVSTNAQFDDWMYDENGLPR